MPGLAHFRLRDTDTQVAAGVRQHSLSVTVDFHHVYTFDRSGRLLGYFDQGVYYRRGLDHRLIRKTRSDDGGWEVHHLDASEADSEYTRIFQPLLAIAEHLKKNRVVWADHTDIPERRRQALTVFSQVAAMSPAALAANAERFREVYTPVAILPPDQYLALVVQFTEGCSYNRCRFCHFYRDQPFRVKSPEELNRHLDQVVRFFGPGIAVRQSVFLADANALVAEPGKLRPLLAMTRNRFFGPEPVKGFAPKGIYSFVDTFHTRFDDPDSWAEFARQGIRRVYLGVESGSNELLAAIDKPADSDSVVRAVTVLKQAGIDVGVILITGLGGAGYAEQHARQSGELLARLPLDGRDLVYFSPYVETGPPEAMAEFGPPLTDTECRAQQAGIEGYLDRRPNRPRTATYGLAEFVY